MVAISLLTVLGQAAPSLAQYRAELWTADSGLPQNIITGLHQTSDGYLWIATLDGLARFDGVRFTVFSKPGTPGIDGNRFACLHADRAGDLWMGQENGSVTRYTQGRFITYAAGTHGLGPTLAQGFTSDAAGRLWVLSDTAIKRWDPSREQFVDVEAPPVRSRYQTLAWGERGGFWGVDGTSLHRFVGGAWERIPLPAALVDPIVAGEDQTGAIWIAAADGRHARIDTRSPASTAVSPAGRSAWGATPATVEWRLPSGRRLTVENSPILYRRLTIGSPPHVVQVLFTHMFEDREGNLWLGTDGQGLYRVRKQVVTVHSEAQGLVGRNIYPILQDRDGAVWLGAWSGGVSRFKDGAFTSFTAKEGISPGGVTALHEDRSGVLWVATHTGVQRLERGRFTPVTTHADARDGAGPARVDHGLAGTQVIHQDLDGAMWFGTEQGLVRQAGGEATLYTTRDGLATNNVRIIIPARTGGLWIGGYGGLARWQDGRFIKWTERDGLPGSTIRTLYEDQDGILWIGTYDSGLGRFHEGRFTRYTTRQGLFNDGVFQILEDATGHFWMSSNRGISRVSRPALNAVARGERREVTAIAYGRSDGMLSAECNGGLWPAGIEARDGRLWFPTQDGVAVIDPASVTPNDRPPPVVIETFLVDREPVAAPAAGEPLRIPPGRRNFEFQYTGLSFVNPAQLRFRYRLAGLDDEWVDAGPRRTAYYSYLPPGRYTFTVLAANSDGVWNTTGSTLAIVVLPPFYRTWWFLTFAAAATAALVVLVLRKRESRLTRAHAVQQAFSRQLIASQEAERKRIASELHDSLGQRLVLIKNLAALVDRSNTDGDDARVDEISSEASLAIQEVREIAQNLRPHQLDRLGLSKSIEALVRKAAAASTIALEAHVDPLEGAFAKVDEVNVYRVVQEGLNNMLKHSAATNARIAVQRSDSQVRLTIEDNGRGFVPETEDDPVRRDGFGLIGIAERVRLLGGRTDVRSAPGEGTTISVTFDLAGARDAQ